MASAVVSTQAEATAAESVILAEIHAGVLVDHATIEQGVEILARLSRGKINPSEAPDNAAKAERFGAFLGAGFCFLF